MSVTEIDCKLPDAFKTSTRLRFAGLKEKLDKLFKHNTDLFELYKTKHSEVVRLSDFITELKSKLQVVQADTTEHDNECAALVDEMINGLDALIVEKNAVKTQQADELARLQGEQNAIMDAFGFIETELNDRTQTRTLPALVEGSAPAPAAAPAPAPQVTEDDEDEGALARPPPPPPASTEGGRRRRKRSPRKLNKRARTVSRKGRKGRKGRKNKNRSRRRN